MVSGRIRWLLLFSAFLLCLVATTLYRPQPAKAHIYRCRGKGGAIHYTNVKVRGGRCVLAVKGSKRARHKRRKKTANTRATNRAPQHTQTASTTPYFPAGKVHIGSAGKCESLPYEDYLRGAASLYSLPEPFLRAVMRVESRCNPKALSPKGAMGLMQLMPQTAMAMGVTNPYDPRQNIYGGARYLRILANRFQGNITLTTAAYNAGSGAVQRYGGIPPYEETQRYVRKVIHHFYSAR